MVDLLDVKSRIDQLRDAAFKHDYSTAKKILKEFNKKYRLGDLPVPALYDRLFWGAGVAIMPDEKRASLREIEAYLPLFDRYSPQKFSLLLKAGQLEASMNKHKISPKYFSEALGLAESLGKSRLIAEAYDSIAHMFSSRYPGLGLYFFRKAERMYGQTRDVHAAAKIKLERAFHASVCWRIFAADRLQSEAVDIVDAVDYAPSNLHEKYWTEYVRAFVKQDQEAILTLLNKLKPNGNPHIICQLEEIYIGLCIEKGLFEKAGVMLETYRRDVNSTYGADRDIKRHLLLLCDAIANKRIERYTPFYIQRKKYEPVTLFDLLDKYAMSDELWALDKSVMRSAFPFHAQEGYFEPVAMPDNSVRLFPMGLAFNVYYRGQAKYYPTSKPGFYRADMTDAKRFVERIRFEEVKKIVEEYPLTKFFREDFFVKTPDSRFLQLPLSIDALALAQHYGVKTELMDLTTDKFVAAFFASTDCKDDVYTPITDGRKDKGIFYRYVDSTLFFERERLRAVGLQPFSRPGEQCGLVYPMNPDDDFNRIATTAEEFVHDKDVSEFIFNYMNRSRKLFPESPIQYLVDKIRKSKTLSTRACEEARNEFYPDVPDDVLRSYLQQEGITISSEISFDLSEEEKAELIHDWKNGESERIARQIWPRFTYRGPFKINESSVKIK